MNRHWLLAPRLPGSPCWPGKAEASGSARSLICPGGYFLCLSIKSSTLGPDAPSPPPAGWDTESPDQALRFKSQLLYVAAEPWPSRVSLSLTPLIYNENNDRTYP